MGKQFLLIPAGSFDSVFEGKIQKVTTKIGSFAVLDFSEFSQPGSYYLKVGEIQTPVFTITNNEKLWQSTLLQSLNFIYSERCGSPVPGIHGTCHEDVIAKHQGTTISFNGGWHDAGDLSQQTVHTAEVTLSLFKLAKAMKNRDPQFAQRVRQEAEWGLDFVLKTRFGDGYRATSAGVSRWTDNQIGNMDDAQARVHNNPLENYLIGGIMAKICTTLDPSDTWYSRLLKIAQEDFTFAEIEFKKQPYAPEPIMWEHTYNTGKSTYLAIKIWTSSLLYKLTKQADYADLATAWFHELRACQETKGLQLDDGISLKGMFYRDETHHVFVHFNHQARENYFADALAELMTSQPNNKEFAQWQQAANDYGDYLEYLQQFTQPYPMIASGLYRDDEYQDKDSFYKQHLLVDQSAEKEFGKQLQKGIRVAPHLYVKRFPVWFSFRGNNGVILSMAQGAAVLGKILQRPRLSDLANQQLEWIIGFNPFGQSMMYGAGYNYPSQYSVSSGEMVGELPVGIETQGNEDVPYWPNFSNATYKEVWISNAGKWINTVLALM